MHLLRLMTLQDDGRYAAEFTIPLEHPAIPGHFPGNPVVPGVLLLDEIRNVAERWLGHELAIVRLPQAKFVKPLLPGQMATVELTRAGAMVGFVVISGAEVIAKGSFEFGTAAES